MQAAPQEIIRAKRDGQVLTAAQVQAFVDGVAGGGWSEGQVAAMAMAIVLRGMERAETVALTRAMAASGERLDWRAAGLDGPFVDKHSTGGVGDKTSIVLAPLVAACGGIVPMISGRGLGHTGGTLDKLEALPGYTTDPGRTVLLHSLREAGCAIVGASERLAPADRRLYAIRDVTATVESVALITGSILSKKLAAGLDALVMDVKVGNGAFCRSLAEARALAASLVEVAAGAGLPTVALLTGMDCVLGRSAGNALEVAEAIDMLAGRGVDARFEAVVLALAGEMLAAGGLAASPREGEARAREALASGHAAERFARMVAALGGPPDVMADDRLPRAPVVREVTAPVAGVVQAVDTRALGLAVVALGGGRTRPGAPVDPRVGLAHVLAPGERVGAGELLAMVHAATPSDAEAAVAAVRAAFTIAEGTVSSPPVIVERIGPAPAEAP